MEEEVTLLFRIRFAYLFCFVTILTVCLVLLGMNETFIVIAFSYSGIVWMIQTLVTELIIRKTECIKHIVAVTPETIRTRDYLLAWAYCAFTLTNLFGSMLFFAPLRTFAIQSWIRFQLEFLFYFQLAWMTRASNWYGEVDHPKYSGVKHYWEVNRRLFVVTLVSVAVHEIGDLPVTAMDLLGDGMIIYMVVFCIWSKIKDWRGLVLPVIVSPV